MLHVINRGYDINTGHYLKRVVINIRASKNISGLVKISVTSPAGLIKFLEVGRSISVDLLCLVSFIPIGFAMGNWSSAKLHSFLLYILGVCSRSWPSVFFFFFCGI